jgi:RNA-directed DNA polymerase
VDVSEMQRKLSQWATDDPTKRLVDLYSLLCNEGWLRVAHHSVNTNAGRETAGIDGKTMSNFNGDVDGNIKRLSEALKTKTFEPMPVRRTYIPKSNGKKRPLGIPMCPAYCISWASLLGIVLAEPAYLSQLHGPRLSLITPTSK